MNQFVLSGRGGGQITDWRAWTRPKKANQWRTGRSAMELARAWFVSPTPLCPPEIVDLLASHPGVTDLTLVEGIPEYVTALPEQGEGRNHDLLLLARGARGNAVISVEAKVDESFGQTIGSYWDTARRSAAPTRAPERIGTLLSMIFGPMARPDTDPWRGLRYQLLSAVAGAAIEASRRQADAAILVVHEFRTESIDSDNLALNEEDLRTFIAVLFSLQAGDVVHGRLYGPAALSPSKHLTPAVDFFMGKAVFDWQPTDGPPKQRLERTG